MNGKLKKFSLSIILILVLVLVALFSNIRKEPPVVSDLPIISVNCNFEGGQNSGLTDLLNLILPSNSKQAVVLNGELQQFANTDIVSVPDRKAFLQTADLSTLAERSDEELSIITDPSLQRLTIIPKIPAHSVGKLYLQTNRTWSEPSLSLEVNHRQYLAKKISAKWFALEGIEIVENQVIGLEAEAKILQAYFVFSVDQASRLSAEQTKIEKLNLVNSFSIQLSSPGFSMVEVSSKYAVLNPSIDKLDLQPLGFYYYENIKGDKTDLINQTTAKGAYLIKDSGRYQLEDKKATFLTLIFIIILILLPIMLLTNSDEFKPLKEIYSKVKKQIGENHFLVVAYLIWIAILVIIKLGPGVPGLSRSLLLGLTILPVLLYTRFVLSILVLCGFILIWGNLLLGLIDHQPDAIFKLVFVIIVLIAARLFLEKIFAKKSHD